MEHRIGITYASITGGSIGLHEAEEKLLNPWLEDHPDFGPVMFWDPENKTARITIAFETTLVDAASMALGISHGMLERRGITMYHPVGVSVLEAAREE